MEEIERKSASEGVACPCIPTEHFKAIVATLSVRYMGRCLAAAVGASIHRKSAGTAKSSLLMSPRFTSP